MSIELDALRYIGVYEEPDTAYGTDHSGTPGDFLPFPFKEGTLDAKGARELLDPMTGKVRVDGHSEKILGIRTCTVNVGTTLHSHGIDLDGDAAPPTTATWALMRVLQAIMGGSISTTDESAQTTVQSSTTTTITVDSGHGVRFQAGGAIAAPVVSGSATVEAREVLSVATDTITVKEAFSAVPVVGQPVRGAVTFYLTEDPDTSLQWLVEGREGHDGAIYCGSQGGFSVEIPIGQMPTLSLALTGAYWSRLGSSAATIPTYSVYSPISAQHAELTVPTVGVTARVEICESAVTFAPQIAYAAVKCGGSLETVKRMRRQPARPVIGGTFTAPYEDDTWYDARDNRTDHAVFLQVGNLIGDPNGVVLFSAPTVQITDVQPAASETAIAGQQVTWEGRHDEAIGGATEVGYSAMRMHFF